MVLGSFMRFAKNVVDAAKKGGLGKKDLQKLERLLTRDGKKNIVLAAGLVSALRTGATDKEVKEVGSLFERASDRISKGKKPFTKNEEKTLRDILTGAGVSERTSRWISSNVDALLADEINEFIAGKKLERGFVPSKKAFALKKKKKKKASLR